MTGRELPAVVEPGSDEHLALIRKAYDAVYTPWWIGPYARDVYRAGRVDGERARVATPAFRRSVESRRTRWFWRAMELLASFTTLAGMWEGSTTVAGSLWYLAAGAFFVAVSFKRRLHGLQLLNFAALAIETYNLWSAMR